jgi:DNA-binding transcriptional LysR family regulator
VNDRTPPSSSADAPQATRDSELPVRSLRYFVAVAEELNFTRAAARLFVAQQALSRDVAQLERRLGVGLFARTTRRVTLTPDGERLLPRARELIALHDEIVEGAAAPDRPIIVDLLSAGRLTASRVLEAARSAAPDLDFRGVYGGGVGGALHRLRTAEIDVAFGRIDWRGRPSRSGLKARLIRYEPLAVLLPRAHPLADLDALPLARLRGQELDTNPAHPDAAEWNDLMDQLLDLTGAVATPPHVPAIGLDDQAHHLIRQNLPIVTSLDHVAVPGGVVRPLIEPTPIYPWWMVWRSSLGRSPVDALDSAIDAVADETWLDLPDDAWLPEPEASRVRETGVTKSSSSRPAGGLPSAEEHADR